MCNGICRIPDKTGCFNRPETWVTETWVTDRSGDMGYTFAPNGFSSGCNEFYARTAKDAVRQGREVAHNARLEAAGLKQPETDNVAKLKKAK